MYKHQKSSRQTQKTFHDHSAPTDSLSAPPITDSWASNLVRKTSNFPLPHQLFSSSSFVVGGGHKIHFLPSLSPSLRVRLQLLSLRLIPLPCLHFKFPAAGREGKIFFIHAIALVSVLLLLWREGSSRLDCDQKKGPPVSQVAWSGRMGWCLMGMWTAPPQPAAESGQKGVGPPPPKRILVPTPWVRLRQRQNNLALSLPSSSASAYFRAPPASSHITHWLRRRFVPSLPMRRPLRYVGHLLSYPPPSFPPSILSRPPVPYACWMMCPPLLLPLFFRWCLGG